MKTKIISLSFIIAALCTLPSVAQVQKKFSLYKPEENAKSALDSVISEAAKKGKNVFVQIGGNWCSWCARFHELATNDKQVDSTIQRNFVVYHLNYSKENKNPELLRQLEYPQRFGFPVFIILDSKGRKLHTQNSSYLEEGKGYSKDKVISFLNDWSPAAFDPEQYKNY
jgi:thioredoxin-related protein